MSVYFMTGYLVFVAVISIAVDIGLTKYDKWKDKKPSD